MRALNGRLVVVKRQTDVTEGEVGDTGSLTPQPQMAEPVLERRSGRPGSPPCGVRDDKGASPWPKALEPRARIRDLTACAGAVIARA